MWLDIKFLMEKAKRESGATRERPPADQPPKAADHLANGGNNDSSELKSYLQNVDKAVELPQQADGEVRKILR